VSILFHSTFFVDSFGVAMNNRVFFLHAAVEEMQTTGYLCEQTLQSLSKDELMLVIERAQSAGDNN
jgi:hypothetical protein